MKNLLFKLINKHSEVYEVLKYIDFKTRWRYRQRKHEARVHSMTYEQYEKMDAQIYENAMGKPLDFSNLQTYSEKMQWAKIYDQDPRKTICADKLAVREFVKDRIGENYLIPLLGVWDRYSDIDFNKLPNQFVLKTNCGSGDVSIVKDKNNLSFSEKIKMKRKIEESINCDFSTLLCERHYSNIPPKIIAEKYICDNDGELNDYKFMCFNGEPKFVWVDVGRYTDHRRNIYDLNWNLLPFTMTFPNVNNPVKQPKNFSEMVRIASALSEGFSHVRVDLYNIDGRIYFGEMTFSSDAGFEKCYPEIFDKKIGEMWNLKMITDKKSDELVY